MPIKICKRCGNEFEARSVRGSYCAGACFRAHEREATKARSSRFTLERRRAHIAVGGAIAKGDLIPLPCELCGSRQNVEAHHDDYARPLDVRWLCKRHHKQHHDKFGPGLNAYRKEVSA